MQTTRVTSNSGQLKGCRIFGASISKATETATFYAQGGIAVVLPLPLVPVM